MIFQPFTPRSLTESVRSDSSKFLVVDSFSLRYNFARSFQKIAQYKIERVVKKVNKQINIPLCDALNESVSNILWRDMSHKIGSLNYQARKKK
jgi:hypothetical protein